MPASSLVWTLKPFAALTGAEVYAILGARAAVFVVEQRCLYEDADFVDQHCQHLVAHTATGEFAAYVRLVPPGLKYHEPAIGRVLTMPCIRGQKLGAVLMQRAIAQCHALFGRSAIRLSAQQHLEAFYATLGFRADSEVYDEDGIPHVEMVLA
jgi:ElaA protein